MANVSTNSPAVFIRICWLLFAVALPGKSVALAAIIELPDQRPSIIVPDMSLRALHALRWEGNGADGKFKELAGVMPLPARIQRITRLADVQGTACVLLADKSWRQVTLTNAH